MITSTANPQVKNLILLGKQSKARKEQGRFLIEGRKLFAEAPKEWLDKIYVSESFLAEAENRNMLEKKGLPYEILSDSVLKAAGTAKAPQGILATVAMPEWNLQDVLKEKQGFYLFLEDIQDPGNAGTMLRTAEGAGITAVFASAKTVDPYNPKTVRATMGSIFRVPFFVKEDFLDFLWEMKNRGITIYAAQLEGSVWYDRPDYKRSFGFLIGNEGNGLTGEAVSLADLSVKIPMEGRVESLNAAVTAAIFMYEADRQRRGG